MHPMSAVRDLGSGAAASRLVHRPALVRLDVAEGDPPQRSTGTIGRDRLAHEREHRPRTGVEQQRLLVVDQELVEREAGGADLGHEGGQAVDAVGDLVDSSLHRESFQSVLVRGEAGVLRTPSPCRALGEGAKELDGVDGHRVADPRRT